MKTLRNKKVILIGENHSDDYCNWLVEKTLSIFKPDFLLTEHTQYTNVYPEDVDERLKNLGKDGNPNIRSRPYVYAVGCNSQFTLLLLDKFSNVACIYIKGSARYVVEIMAGLNISPEDIPYPINTLFMYTVEGVDYIDNRETYNSKVESQIWSKMMDELRSTRELLDSLRDG